MIMPEGNMREVVNIIIVEDDEMDVEFLKRLFQKENIQNPVYHAENGIEALKIMRGDGGSERVPNPFIVLLDINMPLMNGMEFLKELRGDERLKDSVVFVLTTSPRDEDKNAAYKLNVAGYFLKKDVKDLINLLDLYWTLNEFPGGQPAAI